MVADVEVALFNDRFDIRSQTIKLALEKASELTGCLEEPEKVEQYVINSARAIRSNSIFKYLSSEDKSAINIRDFDEVKVLGKGAQGTVKLVVKRDTKKKYAMKVIEKINLIDDEQRIQSTLVEKFVLQNLSHPFIVKTDFVTVD